MKRSEVQGTIEAVLAPLLKRLDDLEGDKAADEKEQQTDQDAHVKEIVEDMLAPLIARIEALEKMRGASKQAAAEKDGEEEVKNRFGADCFNLEEEDNEKSRDYS